MGFPGCLARSVCNRTCLAPWYWNRASASAGGDAGRRSIASGRRGSAGGRAHGDRSGAAFLDRSDPELAFPLPMAYELYSFREWGPSFDASTLDCLRCRLCARDVRGRGRTRARGRGRLECLDWRHPQLRQQSAAPTRRRLPRRRRAGRSSEGYVDHQRVRARRNGSAGEPAAIRSLRSGQRLPLQRLLVPELARRRFRWSVALGGGQPLERHAELRPSEVHVGTRRPPRADPEPAHGADRPRQRRVLAPSEVAVDRRVHRHVHLQQR